MPALRRVARRTGLVLAVVLALGPVASIGAAAPARAATPDLTQTSYSLGVLVLKYFPTADGVNVDQSVTGDVGGTVASLRDKTTSVTSNLVSDLSAGTQYHGYANPSAPAALSFNVVDTLEYDTAVPTVANPFYNPPANPYAARPNYPSVMNTANICNYVNTRGVSEVWMFAYQGPSQLQIDESKMSGPNGDVSNEWTHDALPVCNKTYTLYTFNYGRGTAEAFHSHAHQYEYELRYVDNQQYADGSYLFNSLFEGDNYPQTHGVTGHCGSVHNPPNAKNEYDWADTSPWASDCLNWDPNNPGKTATQISCTAWDLNDPTCADVSDTDNSQLNYILWWEQNIPGRGNTVTYRGQLLRNWWDVHGKWDWIVSYDLGLTLSQYDFADGAVDGWQSSGNVTALSNSDSVGGMNAFNALAATFHSTSAGDLPYIRVNPAAGGPSADQTVSAYLYLIPSGSVNPIVTAKLYVQDSKYAWHVAVPVTLSPAPGWVRVSFTPTGYTGNALQVGLQLQETPYNTATTVFVSAVGWH